MREISTWFSSWGHLQSIAISSVVFYLFAVVLVRFMGKRVTAQMNSFDWIITVAVGSLLASAILLKEVAIADGALAALILAGCQWVMTKMSVKSQGFENTVKPTPRLLVHDGAYLHEEMDAERISKAEVDAALREKGYSSIEDVKWVILETNGMMSVISRNGQSLEDANLLDQTSAPKSRPAP
jgi:uncharacterized membrane protein YcaP (DUF421 family)